MDNEKIQEATKLATNWRNKMYPLLNNAFKKDKTFSYGRNLLATHALLAEMLLHFIKINFSTPQECAQQFIRFYTDHKEDVNQVVGSFLDHEGKDFRKTFLEEISNLQQEEKTLTPSIN